VRGIKPTEWRMNLSAILEDSSTLSTVIPLAVLIGCIRKSNAILRILSVYLIISLVSDLLCGWLKLSGVPNHIVICTFAYIELICITGMFYLANNRINKMRHIYMLAGFTAFCLISVLTNDINRAYAWINTIETLIVLTYSVIYLFRLIDNMNIEKLTDYYFFWINTAFLTYFSAVFFVFLFSYKILTNTGPDYAIDLWSIHNTFHILYNFLLAFGVYKWKKASK
jgi:hypothetical protein